MAQESRTTTTDARGDGGLFSDSKAVETYTLHAGVSAAVAGVCLFMIVGTNVEPSVAFLVAAVAVVVGLGAGVLAVVTALRRRSHLVLPALSLLAVVVAVAVLVAVVNQPRRPRCPSHLRQIGQGLILYAMDHQQQCPETLQELVTLGHIEAEVLVCPFNSSGGDTSVTSYVYLKPRRSFDKVLADEVLAYGPLQHHEIGANVLFGDGHVEWFDKSGFEEVVADAQCLSLWLDGAPSAR